MIFLLFINLFSSLSTVELSTLASRDSITPLGAGGRCRGRREETAISDFNIIKSINAVGDTRSNRHVKPAVWPTIESSKQKNHKCEIQGWGAGKFFSGSELFFQAAPALAPDFFP